ncbi:MAG: RDD family protein [Erysipelotrichaceae bacterium]
MQLLLKFKNHLKTINLNYLFLRFKAMIIDLTIISSPSIIFIDVALLSFASYLPFELLSFIMITFPYLFILVFIFLNLIINRLYKKQSIGLNKMKLKIVKNDHHEIDTKLFIKREVFYKGIIVILFILSFKIMIVYLLINLIIIIFDNDSRSIVDIILKTKIIEIKKIVL